MPANGTTVDCEQLRQDDQHVLEHHQFHVSARVYDSSFSFRRHDGDPRIDHVMSECGLFVERMSFAEIRIYTRMNGKNGFAQVSKSLYGSENNFARIVKIIMEDV